MLVAAVTIVVLAVGLFTFVANHDPDSIQTDTIPPTPAPSTAPATTAPMLPVDSPLQTLPATTPPSSPPPGQEITVTADSVEFGDRLVGLIGNMDRADGRTYVIAGHNPSGERRLDVPEEAVLAAFDDAGRELWRTELDGRPVEVVAFEGDVWVLHEFGMTGALSRIDASNGRTLGHVTFGNATGLTGAFGSMWVQIGDTPKSAQLIRVDRDMSTTTVELPDRIFSENDDHWPDGAAAGGDAIWIPLGEGGVAAIDPATLEVTVMPADDIGHDVLEVAFDGDVTYVASRSQVTSIVDGQVRATVAPGQIVGGAVVLSEIQYLGPIDGVFGVQLPERWFAVLRPNAPMVVEYRRVPDAAAASEIDGEAWIETGQNYNLRRVKFLEASETGG